MHPLKSTPSWKLTDSLTSQTGGTAVIDTDWLTTRPIAHRGLHDFRAGIPENSLSAFARAADAGYPIELDVQVSVDGKAVVFHDESLDRMTGARGEISRVPAVELAGLRLGESDQSIPLLREVLDLIDGRVPLIIELKNPRRRTGRVETAASKDLAGYGGPCAVSSFNRRTVAWCARNLPHLPRGQNVMKFRRGWFATGQWQSSVFREFRTRHSTRLQFIGCHIGALPSPGAQRFRERGIPLIVFTVRTPDRLALANAHADNIFFEGFIP
mgnify:FL=1